MIHPEPKVEPNEEDYGIYTIPSDKNDGICSIGPPTMSPRPTWKEDSSDEESECEFDYLSSENLTPPQP
jgi:hypothetical protein